MFLTTCILAGCDYLNQISGVGFKTAQKSIGRVTTFRGFLSEVSNKSMIPQDYELIYKVCKTQILKNEIVRRTFQQDHYWSF